MECTESPEVLQCSLQLRRVTDRQFASPSRYTRAVAASLAYDVIVVGAGVEGSSTAYQLIKNGVRRVLLLEQFHARHTRGSSHGGSRCTRQAVTSHLREFSRMVTLSIDMFAELQRENGKQLYCPIDVLSFNSGSDPVLNQTISRLKKDGIPSTVISAKEINQRYSSRLCVPEDYIGLIEPDMKLLNMTAILCLFQDLFVRGGGVLLDNHCVTDIVPGDRVIVRTNKGDFISRKVVITAGAWAPKLISKLGVQLPIKILRAEVLYWKVDNPDDFKPEVFPWVIYERGKEHCFVFPEFEYPGMIKVYHRTYRDIEVDDRDEGGAGPESVEKVVRFIRTYLRGVATTPAIFEPCVYSMTDDRLPIIDQVPAHPNIVFAAGMSGRGAMISPTVGLLLTEMTLDKSLSFDLTAFRVARFFKPKL